MKYENIVHGQFIDRPNRFVAHVTIDGKYETVHVKNTGRCRELLLPGAEVILSRSDNPARKTAYDLIAVYKDGLGLVNIDSQAPNYVAGEWLSGQDFTYIKPEYTYGSSRIDFYMERQAGAERAAIAGVTDGMGASERYLMEVKGCTLERDGIGYFPDAPTERGVKHLRELAGAVADGYHAIIAFVIQMEGISEVRPNIETHAEFGKALREAEEAGVKILFLLCDVTEDSLSVKEMKIK